MPVDKIDIQFFEKTDSLAPSSHEMTRGQLYESSKTWVCKKISTSISARYELLGQEFYRLIIPHQPETRIARDFFDDQYYILSEEIEGFSPLPLHQKAHFKNGYYSGLGQVLVVSIFLHEIDLNPGNLGINRQGKVLKIDGDWSFAFVLHPELFLDKPVHITYELIDHLPFLNGYFAYNWLDIISVGRVYPASNIVDTSLSDATDFKAEVNEAILKILCVPTWYLQQFIDRYVHRPTTALNDTLRSRQLDLKLSAMQRESFVRYLLSPLAREILTDFRYQLKQFTAHIRFPIMSASSYEIFDRDLDAQFDDLVALGRTKRDLSPTTVVAMDGMVSSPVNVNGFFYAAKSTVTPLKRNKTSGNLASMSASI